MIKKFAFLIVGGLLLAACTHTGLNPEPVATPLPDDQIERPNNEVPVFPTEPGEPNTGDSADCGIENCHGLEIECGSNVAQVCTMQYELGDFCRDYAECGVVDGSCQQLENPTFTECRSCVEECLNLSEIEDQFQCEEQCRVEITGEESSL